MKVELVNDELYHIYINKYYIKDFNKTELISTIKDLIIKINKRYRLNLRGFYKINVYPNKKIGACIDLIKIDENEYSSGIDFRIVVYQNEIFYLELEDIEELESCTVGYYNEKFYINLDNIKDINKYIDRSRVVYGEELRKVVKNIKLIIL